MSYSEGGNTLLFLATSITFSSQFVKKMEGIALKIRIKFSWNVHYLDKDGCGFNSFKLKYWNIVVVGNLFLEFLCFYSISHLGMYFIGI